MKTPASVVITDLDNTLFDWVAMWYASFSAMVTEIVTISRLPADVILDDIKKVHQAHGTSEYTFLIEEIECLTRLHPGENLQEVYANAISAYRSQRKATLRLYSGVLETLKILKSSGCLLVGYTESLAFSSSYRMRRLDLDLYFDFLYSPEDHDFPRGLTPEQVRRYPADTYAFRNTIHRYTPKGELKPNPKLLMEILHSTGADAAEAVYVGDNLIKDVGMAQKARVLDVWAKYGTSIHKNEYDLLRRVTHWTPTAVEKERTITEEHISPAVVLQDSFAELLDHVEPRPFVPVQHI